MAFKAVKKHLALGCVYAVAILVAFFGLSQAQAQSAVPAQAFLYRVLSQASMKYYGKTLVDQLNTQFYFGLMNDQEKSDLEKNIFTKDSRLVEWADELTNELFSLKEVQEALLRTYFTKEKYQLMQGYLSLVKKHVDQGAITHIEDRWNARAYFKKQISSFRLVWLTQKDLDKATRKTMINGKQAQVIVTQRDEFMGLPTDLTWIMEQGPEFYTSYNAAAERISENPNPAMIVNPLYFSNLSKNLGLFTVMSHEIGHALGFHNAFKGPQTSINAESSASQELIKETSFLPLYACMSQKPVEEAKKTYKIKLEEIRADLVAHWSLQSLINERGLDPKAAVAKAFESVTAKYLTSEEISRYDNDVQPSPDQRLRLFQGECSLDQFPAFVEN